MLCLYYTLTENAKQCHSARKNKTQKIPDAILAMHRRTMLRPLSMNCFVVFSSTARTKNLSANFFHYSIKPKIFQDFMFQYLRSSSSVPWVSLLLFCVCVIDSTCSKTLVSWTVHCVEDKRLTLSGCFEMVVARSDETTQAHLSNHKLEEACVGKSKDALDTVSDTGMLRESRKNAMCMVFLMSCMTTARHRRCMCRVDVSLYTYHYTYYQVTVWRSWLFRLTSTWSSMWRKILFSNLLLVYPMHSKFWCHLKLAKVYTRTLSSSIVQPRNKKEEFHNAIICFFQNENLTSTPSEVFHGVAGNTVKMLSDVLWYIDGQHSKLSERSCEVPVIFSQFTGYNKPERSKHRKQVNTYLSYDILASLSMTIFKPTVRFLVPIHVEVIQTGSRGFVEKSWEILWHPEV